jgi:hypothetical protein
MERARPWPVVRPLCDLLGVESLPGRRLTLPPCPGEGPGAVACRECGRTIARGTGSIRTSGPAYGLAAKGVWRANGNEDAVAVTQHNRALAGSGCEFSFHDVQLFGVAGVPVGGTCAPTGKVPSTRS